MKKARNLGMEIIAEAEEASRLYKGHWCAVTGSNGKTTTTTLLGEMLATLPVKTAVAGTSALPEQGTPGPGPGFLGGGGTVQLPAGRDHQPGAGRGCIVNITPDHFERHGDMAGYVAAKSKIFAFQTPDQILILNADDPVSSKLGDKAEAG